MITKTHALINLEILCSCDFDTILPGCDIFWAAACVSLTELHNNAMFWFISAKYVYFQSNTCKNALIILKILFPVMPFIFGLTPNILFR